MKYKILDYDREQHPHYWRDLEDILNSEEFYRKFEFVQVVEYKSAYVFKILVREKL